MSLLIECPKIDGRFELLPRLRYTALVEVDYWTERAMQADSAEEIVTLMRECMDEFEKENLTDYRIEGYIFLTHELLNGGAEHDGMVRRMMHEERVHRWVLDDGFYDELI